MNAYLEAYLSPAFEGSANVNPLLWQLPYESTKSYNFSVNITAGASFLPASMKDFDFFGINRTTNFELSNPTNNILPTIVGRDSDNELFFYVTDNNGNRIFDPIKGHHVRAEIDVADGFDFQTPIIPTASIQVGGWFPIHTGIGLRYIPTVIGEDIRFGSFGISVMHNPLGWFNLPVDLLIGVNYNQMNFIGENFVEDANPNRFEIDSRSMALDVTVAKSFGIIKPYLSVNIINSTSDAALRGTFNYTFSDYIGVPSTVIQGVQFNVKDPVDFRATHSFVNAGVGAILSWNSLFLNGQLMFGRFQNFGLSLGYKIGF
ncbi:hypothetical protein JCM31826_19650 [Thermaurantimonas aggregans]|uniref:Uncharacterized protein n=2 Tax=Thermaurantimonas aggregans TaxID=2173829 RepID=A0A401XND5_9FLAO|nr:hypothetical protein JCM31826_19650 [Thermaurantimonas aggregans]